MGGHPGRLAVLVIVLVSGVVAKDDHSAESQTSRPSAGSSFDFVQGELDHCIKDKTGKKTNIGANLGRGWDILDFSVHKYVVALTYKDCSPTQDGKHFMPDQAEALTKPSKERFHNVDAFESLKSYISRPARSFSRGSNDSAPRPPFPGVFSERTEIIAKKAQESINFTNTRFQTLMATVQDGVTKFKLGLKPAPKLSKDFSSCVKKIGAAVVLGKPKIADFLSGRLVYQYGTHVIDSVTVGGKIVRTFTNKMDSWGGVYPNMADFRDILEKRFSYSKSSKITMDPGETSNKAHQSVKQIDATIVGGTNDYNLRVDDWIKSVDKNMTIIEQGGKPIFELITKKNFPGYKQSTLSKISQKIIEAMKRYYEKNTFVGCTHIDEPGFDFQASSDDPFQCRVELQPSFGGFFGYLKMSPKREIGQTERKNPATSDFTCPEGYHSVLLDSHTKSYDNGYVTTTMNYCVGMVEKQKYYFGGYFKNKPCPKNFGSYSLEPAMSDLTLCFSQTSEAKKDSVPFGGMYTCDQGNPLANPIQGIPKMDAGQVKAEFEKNLKKDWKPKACPPGFKEEEALNEITRWGFQLAEGVKTIKENTFMEMTITECRVVICVGRPPGPRKINRPPFSFVPLSARDFAGPEYDDDDNDDDDGDKESEKEEEFPIALVAFIALGVLAVLVIVAVVIVVVIKKRKKQQAKGTKGKGPPSKKAVGGPADAGAESPQPQTPVGAVMSFMFSTGPDQDTTRPGTVTRT